MKQKFVNKYILFAFYVVLKIRHFLFDKKILKSKKFDIPIISVGNISVGGTGKTPHIERLIKELMPTQRVAVLSRGYGRKSKGFLMVGIDDEVTLVGDEPLQIKKKFPTITVAVCEKRVEGVETLLSLPEDQRPTTILLDDAFQHRWITPSTNIVLVDSEMPLEKDYLLPFGRLRDLPGQIKRADIVIVTKCPGGITEDFRDEWERKVESRQKMLFSTIIYKDPVNIFEGADRRYIYSKFAVLISAVANPKPLVRNLSTQYKILGNLQFRDHHNFTNSEVKKINNWAKQWPKAIIYTTEKDAQRLLHKEGLSDDVKKRLFYIPIEVDLVDQDEISEKTIL